MSARGWWDENRLLARGAHGADVAKLQRALNEDLGASLAINGVFDATTEDKLKEFQRLNDLVEDGRAGPVTQSLLYSGNYQFSIHSPPVLQQERFTCWAAALQSALHATWGPGRDKLTVADLLSRYRRFLAARGDITLVGFNQVMKDLKVFGTIVSAKSLKVEPILAELGKNLSHVVLVHDLGMSGVAHAVVIYGVRIREGEMTFLIMDPLIGSLSTLSVGQLRGFASDLVVVAPHRL